MDPVSLEPVGVAVQDSVPLVRLGLRQLLVQNAPRLASLGDVADPSELVDLCAQVRPTVAIFELDPDVDSLVAGCRRGHPDVRLIALHLGRASDHLDQARRLGLQLLSYAAPMETVRDVLLGLALPVGHDAERRRARRTLSMSERLVLRCADEGLTAPETAARLGVPEESVQEMAEVALELLGTETLDAALRRARSAGLVPRRRAG